MSSNGISVVMCCYNSSSRLPETLKHLADQKVPENLAVEIILVNNASTDDTSEKAQAEWQKYQSPFQLKIEVELTPGLSAARAKGIASARYDYILFCDDDNWLSEDYIFTGFNLINSNQSIAVLGGEGQAVCECKPPDWFEKVATEAYAVGNPSGSSGNITEKFGCVYGAGMFLRKSVYCELIEKKFDFVLSDRKGNKTASGGDIELCMACKLLNYLIWFDSRLKFKHYIPKERLTRKYVIKLYKGFGKSQVALYPYTYLSSGYDTRKRLLWLRDLRYLITSLLKKIIFTNVKDGNHFYERLNINLQAAFIIELMRSRGKYDKRVKYFINFKNNLSNPVCQTFSKS